MTQFTSAKFLISAAKPEQFPNTHRPEIAFVGRSNVGKSSLINHLCRHKGLAKVSSTPGKTQLVNFFAVDNSLTLVDLPGYGFAKVPKSEQAKWGAMIEAYLQIRDSHLLLLIDIRRDPTAEDYALVEWASHYNRSLTLVCTKTDKVKNVASPMGRVQKALGINEALPYSIKDGSTRTALIAAINKAI